MTCCANTERIKDVCRPLALTDIIEQLLELRLQAYQEQIAANEPEAGTGMNDDDEVVRPAKRKPNVPKTCVIQAPSVGDVAGIDIRIVLESHKDSPILVEKDANVLEYLILAVAAQLNSDSIQRPARRKLSETESLMKSLSFNYKGRLANSWSFRYKDCTGLHSVNFQAEDEAAACSYARGLLATAHTSPTKPPPAGVAKDDDPEEVEDQIEDEI